MSKFLNTPKNAKTRLAAVLLSVVVLVSACVAGTIAWLVDDTENVVNTFTLGTVPPSIDEDFNGTVKQNVVVTNDGTVDAYIRAAIVVTWQKAATDEDGNFLTDENENLIPSGEIAPVAPIRDEDYTLDLNLKEGWSDARLDVDGYYYYTAPVEAGEDTSVLIAEAKQLKEKEGYKLVIEILAQTVQADGVDEKGNKPVVLAWGVDPENLGTTTNQ